jgi:hypothetical protein
MLASHPYLTIKDWVGQIHEIGYTKAGIAPMVEDGENESKSEQIDDK